jgi:hypothetical protein
MNMTEYPAARYAGTTPAVNALAGPGLAGPALAGPVVAGPVVAGPVVAGPVVAGTARAGTQHGSWLASGRPQRERALRGPATTWLIANTNRCEALFASALQRSDAPTPDMVAQAIAQTARQFGARGCAGRMAQEFGDHPEAAAERMRWVRQLITQP